MVELAIRKQAPRTLLFAMLKKCCNAAGGSPPLKRISPTNPVISAPDRCLEEAFVLNAASRFEVHQEKKRSQTIPLWVQSLLFLAGVIVVFTLAFQFFLRYEYVTTDGAVWRIDRLTQRSCRMEGARCVVPPKPKFSVSTSTSTSTSTSVSAKTLLSKRKN